MAIDNFNTNSLPSEADLQSLANDLFKAAPGAASDGRIDASAPVNETVPQSQVEDYFQNSYLKDISTPSLGNVAGADSSSSAAKNTDFDVNDPPTSLPDPFFYNGQIPSSVAGSGKSSSLIRQNQVKKFESPGSTVVKNDFNIDTLPFASETSFEAELQKVLSDFNHFAPSEQLPQAPGTGFYFLDELSHIGQPAAPSISGIPGVSAVTGSGLQGLSAPFDINKIRSDFPILSEYVNGKRLVWLDNAATTQKPQSVIDRLTYFYQHENSNIHRAAHELAARATDAYEAARGKIQHFLNARSVNEIVFTRGTTESINLVAATWGEQNLKEGDEIILSNLEHHANIVPWQLLAKKKGFVIKVIPVNDDGELLLDEYAKLLGPKTKLVSFTHVSNALGTITPAKTIIEMAHAAGAITLLDGAQSVSHMKEDVQYLNPDFFALSGHKIFGPTGIGVLYGKEELLNQIQPYQGGGNMIKDVTFEHAQFQPAPNKFEAGTGNIADAVGLGAAIDYVNHIGIGLIGEYEHALLQYATSLFHQIPGLQIIGTAKDKASVLSFTLKGYTNDEVGQALNKEGIAVRTGHHCAQPILRRLGHESSVRPSLAFYNTCADIDLLVKTVYRLADQKRRFY